MLVHMADVTTIKVSKPLRDRISAAAARRHQTVQSFMEQVMDEHDRHARLAAVAAAIGAADDETLSGWRSETADWTAVDADVEGAQ
jgi:predicted transcriptional regulator